MQPEPITRELVKPSARQIRDARISAWNEWVDAHGEMPASIKVYRSFDVLKDAMTATIVVKSAVPPNMKWNGR